MRVSLPVEVKLRDLTGTIWLAANLIENGHEVVLGERIALVKGVDVIEPDIFVYNNFSSMERVNNVCEQIQKAGGKVVIIDTEGGVFSSDEKFESSRLNKEMFDKVDIYFSWGNYQSEYLSDNFCFEDEHIVISGHPRFDLLQKDLRQVYQNKAEKYVKKYGEYILVNTNFAAVNNATLPSTRHPEQVIKYQKELIEEYIYMVQKLSNDLENHSIILRPHPAEDEGFYHSKLHQNNSNVHVVRKGNVRPWILGADVVIHKSSTSGIESALLNTPVISYRPVKMADQDADLPIHVSIEKSSYSELYNTVNRYSKDDLEYTLSTGQKDILKNYFDNINGNMAADKIVETLESFSQRSAKLHHRAPVKNKFRRAGFKHFGVNKTEYIGELIPGTSFSKTSTQKQRVPEITEQEVKSEMKKVLTSSGDINITEVNIKQISELRDTFLLTKE